ncbi:MAG: bifunctional D-altronate/D-mannonate dehydratase [Candidatus Latescibacteria bacterium]|nr:bifunctional D-altronate/D-mannonate dehydratase [Candidatus Latescibacterota bacterium]
MKITEVRTIVTCPGRNYVLVKILTDEGVYGVGEGSMNSSEPAVAAMIEHSSQWLIGQNPFNIEDLWQILYRNTYWRGGPVFRTALGALDIALWDLKAKALNVPVYELLGGRARRGVLCYTHSGGGSYDEIVEDVQRCQEAGFRVIRVQHGGYGGPGILGHDPNPIEGFPAIPIFEPGGYLSDTPKMFEHLRMALGDEVELCHDVHEQLGPTDAAWLARALEPFRLYFLEDPVMPEEWEGLRQIRSASTTRIALGEILYNREHIIPLITERLIDFLRTPPMRMGGLTEARKIFSVAEMYDVRTAFHGAQDIGPIAQAASVHFNLAIHNMGVQEWVTYPDAAYEVMPGACTFSEGLANPNPGPGLGIDIDEDLAKKYPFQTARLPIFRRWDGGIHRH